MRLPSRLCEVGPTLIYAQIGKRSPFTTLTVPLLRHSTGNFKEKLIISLINCRVLLLKVQRIAERHQRYVHTDKRNLWLFLRDELNFYVTKAIILIKLISQYRKLSIWSTVFSNVVTVSVIVMYMQSGWGIIKILICVLHVLFRDDWLLLSINLRIYFIGDPEWTNHTVIACSICKFYWIVLSHQILGEN